MSKDQRQMMIERTCRAHGMTPESLKQAARNLGELRALSAAEIGENLSTLEDEIVRHMQVAQALQMLESIPV